MFLFKRKNRRKLPHNDYVLDTRVAFKACKLKNPRSGCMYSIYEYCREERLGHPDFLVDCAVRLLAGYQVASCIKPVPVQDSDKGLVLLSEGMNAAFLRYVWTQQLLVDHTLDIYGFDQYPVADSYTELQTALQDNHFILLLQLYTEHDELVIQFDPQQISIKKIQETLHAICAEQNKIFVTETSSS